MSRPASAPDPDPGDLTADVIPGGRIGILAYGSLIDEPGREIEPVIVRRILCRTPFRVEYARVSKRRSGAPTLVPYDGGACVNAQILVVDLPLREAKDRLYRREIRKDSATYTPPMKVTANSVVIKTLCNFEKVDKAIYTCIRNNIEELTAEKLATLAICSARKRNDSLDGISYLMNAGKAGIRTPLSDAYEAAIFGANKRSRSGGGIEGLSFVSTLSMKGGRSGKQGLATQRGARAARNGKCHEYKGQ